ncbi:hypothetical protein B6D12_12535 [Gilliamella apicola]|uniref:phage baseplate plug family protein n=1 Tax=Gilliamella apicola TaxID=1196095 RepID=UPI000A33F6A4
MHTIQITSDDVSEQSLSLYNMNLKLTLRYNSILRGYQFDLFDIDKNKFITKNKGLSVGAPSLIECNLPFVLILVDKSGRGENSTSKEDFNSRMQIVIMEKGEWRASLKRKE